MLDASLEREALALLGDALDSEPVLEGEALERWLRARCAGRDALMERVRSLVDADRRMSAATVGTAVPGATLLPGGVSVASAAPPPRVGPWRLEELIGSGGMGSVYRASRDDGLFEQQVAVKFVRTTVGRSRWLPLVDAERRLLARMTHPGIARILDAGSTEGGAPFLVMEFVDGVPLDAYVAAQHCDLATRVALLREVCAAVDHAHGHLVLHNDLKPANVLVTADGRPRLIDFGVARLQEGGDSSLPQGFTRAYASPQRLAGEPPAVTDDVYALGVMLRELLDAHPDRELPAAVAMATAADRAARYAGVAAFDDDLRRWQRSLPLRAMPPTLAYRARKLLERHPWRVAAGTAAVVGLIGALATTTALYLRAEEARAQAQQRFNETRDMARFMLFELDDALEALPGSTPVREQMVARSQRYVDALAATARDDIGLQQELAVALRRLAEVQGVPGRANLGKRPQALASIERAATMLDTLQAQQRAAGQLPHWTLLRDLGHVRYVQSLLGGERGADYARQLEQARAADALLVPALAAAERSGAAASALGELHTALLGARLSQAFALRFLERLPEAEKIQAAEEQRLAALPQDVRETIDYDFHRARAPSMLGDSLYYQGRIEEALAAYRRGAEAMEQGLAKKPNHRKLLDGLMVGLYNVGSTLPELGRHEEALQTIARALPIGDRLLALDPHNRQVREMRLVVRDQYATSLHLVGRTREAIDAALAVLREREAIATESPGDNLAFRSSATSLRNLAGMYAAIGDKAGECRMLRLGLERYTELERRGGSSPADLRTDVEPIRKRLQEARCPA